MAVAPARLQLLGSPRKIRHHDIFDAVLGLGGSDDDFGLGIGSTCGTQRLLHAIFTKQGG